MKRLWRWWSRWHWTIACAALTAALTAWTVILLRVLIDRLT